MKPYHILTAICASALLLRLILLPQIQHPGIGDPNHYYNLGVQLVEGKGFYIDYIWQFYNPPQNIVHPDDFWMPGTAVVAAISMKLFGISVQVAILPFLLAGAIVLPLLAYAAARQFGCTRTTSQFAAAASAFLPELVLNSLRTDTTIINTICVCSSIILLTFGLTHNSLRAFIASGFFCGLAYLVRGDNLLLLPMFLMTMVVYRMWGKKSIYWMKVAMVPITALLVTVPWLTHNWLATGSLVTPNLGRMFFFAEFNDHFAYEREFNWQTLLAQQTLGQILGKRLFEMAASLKVMYTTLDVFLPIAMLGGMLLVAATRDKERLLILTPAFILLLGTYFVYTVLAPMGSQGGSFKKSYISLIPLFLPLAAYAVEHTIPEHRFQVGTVMIAVGIMAANGFELVRSDLRFTTIYLASSKVIVNSLKALPDTNNDAEIIVMTQDNFMFRFLGLRSVMIPSENREKVLEVAKRYHVDYILMPTARQSLDTIYNESESDSHFVLVEDIPEFGSKIFGFHFDG